MDLVLTEEQELVRRTVREFAKKEIEPMAKQIDETGEPPLELLKKLGHLGYLGMSVPETYGGSGTDVISYVIVMEELSRACASTSTAVSVQNSLVNDPIVLFGSETQKRKYLPQLAVGKAFGAFGLTEPEAGSDPGAMKTTAVREGNHYRLNGTKRFITNAAFADVFIVFASTNPAAGNKGVSCFIIERGTPGFVIGSEEDKLGIRGTSTCELIFEDCKVPTENLLGDENQGFKIAMITLDGGRIGIAAQAVGIAQAALDEALKYAQERKAFGRTIADFQAIQFKLADMATLLDAARLLVYKSAWKKQQKQEYILESSMAKLFASEIAQKVVDEALQIHGGYGYIKDYKVERLYRDVRITRLYEGTSEIQRLIIARSLLRH